jgi:hypothetical protein
LRREGLDDAPGVPEKLGPKQFQFDFMKRHFALFVCVASVVFAGNSVAADAKGLPHGGTGVVVGSHGYHLELVRDAEKGRLQAYVLDGHADKYVDVLEPSFEMVANVGGKQVRLTLQRTPAASKPLSQASSLFEGTADWVKTATNFTAVIPTITLKGRTFKDVKVNYPKGAIHRAH